MIRLFDFVFALLGLVILLPIMLLLLVIGYMDTGSPIFRQTRVGRNKQDFELFKFRSMYISTKAVATHLANASDITKIGKVLRKSKLDELPQLWNVFIGDMSLVGPRPNLKTQNELIAKRELKGVYKVRPGITGMSQIKRIDMSTPDKLAETDALMIEKMSIWLYFKLIFLTVFGRGFGDPIQK